jgi:hypothetical protein
MEAIRSSETSVLIRATRRHLPEDDNHHSHRRGNLKSYKEGYYFQNCEPRSVVEIFSCFCKLLVYCTTLKMEALYNSEISIPFQKLFSFAVLIKLNSWYVQILAQLQQEVYCTETLRCFPLGQLPRHKKCKLWSTELKGKFPLRRILRSVWPLSCSFSLLPVQKEKENLRA